MTVSRVASSYMAFFLSGIDVKAGILDYGTLAGAELYAAVGDNVQGRNALRHPDGMIEVGWRVEDAMSQPDVFGPLAGSRQYNLRRRRVSVLLQEIVLYFEDVVETQFVGKLYLIQALHYYLLLVAWVPLVGVQGLGTLYLVKQPKLHLMLLCLVFTFWVDIGFPGIV